MSGYPNQPPQSWQSASTPGQYASPPGQQYPQPGQPYAPPGQQHAPPGQQYAPPGQQYAPPGQQYAPPGQQYAPPGQYAPPAQGQYAPGQHAPGQPYPPQPGFAYPFQPNQPNIGPTPTAPSYSYPGHPAVTPQPAQAQIEWIPTTPQQAVGLGDRAVVGGFEGHDGSPLWVIRARHEGDLIPGKFAVKHQSAYVPWGGQEHAVRQIEVCCSRPEKIRWVESRDGVIPANAVIAGNTSSGEPLYAGRAREQGSLTPGKVQPSHKGMYISFAGKEVAHKIYEIMCYV